MDIVEDHRRAQVGSGADRHDAGAAGGRERAVQAGGKREVAEMIGGELELPALWCAGLRARHHAGVVDQDVQRPVPGGDQRRDRCRVGEVHGRDEDVGVGATGHDRRRDTLSCVGVADREGHLRADGGERTCGLQADTRCPTGHDDPAAAQIDPADDLGSGCFPFEGRGDGCGLSHGRLPCVRRSVPEADPVSSESEDPPVRRPA